MKSYELIFKLLNLKGVGRVKANQVLQSLHEFVNKDFIPQDELTNILTRFFSDTEIEKIQDYNIELKINAQFPPIQFINRFQPLFPKALLELNSDCPPILTCIGNLDLLSRTKIGFCGSRKATEKGRGVAKDVAIQVSENSVVVVSGYASGIDQETHYGALVGGGCTIVILPEGINHFTIKKYIQNVWDWERVLVISEFEPNAIWSINRAMTRNTTIVGLSDVMVLIEAKENGGSIDAGYKSLQMNKPLFAPIYDGMPPEASGNDLLLKKGAFPLKKKRETNQANLDRMMEILSRISTTKKTLFD